jgi:flagellar FliJ protein
LIFSKKFAFKMSAQSQLETLLQRAQADRDRATAALRQAERLVEQAQSLTQQLSDYRTEFDERWMTRFRSAGTTELLHCQRGFGQRLNQAIAAQQSNTQQLGNRVELARALLIAREQRVAAVQKLMARRYADAQKIAARRDQRHTDEAAQRHGQLGAGRPLNQRETAC